jgi:hypothetical protein
MVAGRDARAVLVPVHAGPADRPVSSGDADGVGDDVPALPDNGAWGKARGPGGVCCWSAGPCAEVERVSRRHARHCPGNQRRSVSHEILTPSACRSDARVRQGFPAARCVLTHSFRSRPDTPSITLYRSVRSIGSRSWLTRRVSTCHGRRTHDAKPRVTSLAYDHVPSALGPRAHIWIPDAQARVTSSVRGSSPLVLDAPYVAQPGRAKATPVSGQVHGDPAVGSEGHRVRAAALFLPA